MRDRLVHHAIYRVLYPFFDSKFIADSFSCRKWKGTHRAANRFREFASKGSENNTKTLWVLKCDVRKFFASVDQEILLEIMRTHVDDTEVVVLVERVVGSFTSGSVGRGLPLGNLTSQLLVNVYMNEFDQFVKHRLKAKHYIRYADDFVVLSQDRAWLERILPKIREFLFVRLNLELHPDKVSIRTFASGVDFLGWVHFPDHRVLRTVTKRRMFRTIRETKGKAETVQSYRGMLRHGNTEKVLREMEAVLPEMNKQFENASTLGIRDIPS